MDKVTVPKYVDWVAEKLKEAGFEAYLVGGSVRDLVRGAKPKDYDLATNAEPKKIQEIFPNSIAVGAAFGIITVLAPDEKGENYEVEVATYRLEEDYVDGRWPTKVEFTDDITKDLGRRDFTVNAMAYPLHISEAERAVLDPFEGQKDLDRKVVRAVGDPVERLKEDGLRGFRACRMASNWGFAVDSELKKAIKSTTDIARQVSMERIRDEFMRLLVESPTPSVGIELLRETDLLKGFMPELLEGIEVKQAKVHVDNVYEHLLRTVDKAIDEVKLAALFHDIGKSRTQTVQKGDKHFYGHETESASMAHEIMKRMKFSNAEIKKVINLVRYHMFWYHEEWSDAAVRRLLRRVGGEEMFELLLALRMADSQSNPNSDFKPWVVERLQERVAIIKKEEMALKVSDLKIGGKEVIKLGVPKDIRVRVILNYLLDLVVDDPKRNTLGFLEQEVKKYLENGCKIVGFFDEDDMPIEDAEADKGYVEDAKKKGFCYRVVEIRLLKGKTLKGWCFPDEGYDRAAKRILWEQTKGEYSADELKKSDMSKGKGKDGVCVFISKFTLKSQ